MTDVKSRLAAVILATAFFGSFDASARSAVAIPSGAEDKPYIEFVIGDQIVRGWVIRTTETGFDFLDAAAGVVVNNLSWSLLPDSTAIRLRGTDDASGKEGDLVSATKLLLDNGQEVVGIELKEQSTDRDMFLTNRTTPSFAIRRSTIVSILRVDVPETEIYSREDLYRRKMNALSPGGDPNGLSAQGNFELAEYLIKIEYYDKARDHFRRAMLEDERFEERARDRLLVVDSLLEREAMVGLEREIGRQIRSQQYVEALASIEMLGRLAPDSPEHRRWVARLVEVEDKLTEQLRKNIAEAHHAQMEHLLRTWAFGRVTDGGDIPGRSLALANGDRIQGRFISEDEKEIVIETLDGTTIRIGREMVVSAVSVNLNRDRKEASLQDARNYISDASGLRSEIISGLATVFAPVITGFARHISGGGDAENVDVQAELTRIWEGRTKSEVVITRRGRTRINPVSAPRRMNWGFGSWIQLGATPRLPAGRTFSEEEWWSGLRREDRYDILRAMAVTEIYEVLGHTAQNCSNCGGAGTTRTVSTSGTTSEDICGMCLGAKRIITVRYR